MTWEIPLVGWKVNPGVVALLLGVIIIYQMFIRKKYSMPPGPFALPIIGNLIQLYVMKEKLYRTAVDWGKRYGPIITVQIGSQRCVVINNLDLVLEATIKKPTDFAGRPTSPTIEYFSMGRKDIVMADYGPTWRLHRKIAFQAMKNYASGKNLEKKIHLVFEKMNDHLESSLNEPISPQQYISLLIYNFICSFCWGETYDLNNEDFTAMVRLNDTLNQEFGNGLPEDMIPILRYVPYPRRTKLFGMTEQLFAIIREKYDAHCATFNPDNIRDFIDDLLLARLEAAKEKSETLEQLTDSHLFQTIVDIFSAGTDTSRFTLIFALYNMVKHPDIQEKVHKEISTVVGHDRLPGLADRENLPYTEATLHEIMRVDPIAPVGVPHCAMVDSTIGGYDIPKGTVIFLNTWALHMDPGHWPNPKKFDPNRFLDPDGTLAPKPAAFFPFSAGRRVCLGEAVAKPELLLLFACLMQRYRYTLPPGTELPIHNVPGSLSHVPDPKFLVVATPRY